MLASTSIRMLRLTSQHAGRSFFLRSALSAKQPCITATGLPKQSCLTSLSTSALVKSDGRKVRDGEGFWTKNERMKRPMSPHITIYSFPMPAVMSITNRITGAGWSFVIVGAGWGALMYPGDSASMLAMVKAMEIPLYVMVSGKFVLLWPFVYHTINSIRHLVWDFSKKTGLYIDSIYSTGYIIWALSFLVTGAGVGLCYYPCEEKTPEVEA